MAKQGKAVDTYMYNVVKAKLITTPHQFIKVAEKKNIVMFYKKIRLPFVILLVISVSFFAFCIVLIPTNHNTATSPTSTDAT